MPRILTNKHNLPETLVKAIQYDTHKQVGTISVTTLIDSAQIRLLKARHNYESDVTDNVPALIGTALHNVLERANIENVRKRAFILTAETMVAKAAELKGSAPERALQIEKAAKWIFSLVPVFFPEIAQRYIFEQTISMDFGDHVISGTFDLYDKETGILWDYKFCRVFQYMNVESRRKWEQQTNIYAYGIVTELGLPVNGIRILAFFSDWNSHAVTYQKNYPTERIKEIEIPMRPQEKIKAYIEHRLSLHRDADAGQTVNCTGEDRWATADEYALKNGQIKRAIVKLPTMALAEKYKQENIHRMPKLWIEYRPGSSLRCNNYCPVSQFCPQYKVIYEQKRSIGS